MNNNTEELKSNLLQMHEMIERIIHNDNGYNEFDIKEVIRKSFNEYSNKTNRDKELINKILDELYEVILINIEYINIDSPYIIMKKEDIKKIDEMAEYSYHSIDDTLNITKELKEYEERDRQERYRKIMEKEKNIK
jgi:phosphoenolpyruvate carboxylase